LDWGCFPAIVKPALAGYSYGQFGSLLVNLAAHRHPFLGSLEAEHERQVLPGMPSAD
jgi:hypothetical protein